MIYSLDGTLTYFDQNFAVVSCGGVGFKCFTTLTTLQSLPGVGKPVQLFTYCPKYMGPPQWSDMGMWLQSVMLLLVEAGLASCPQECWAMYGATVRRTLALDDGQILFTGLAIGYADEGAAVNQWPVPRVGLDEVIDWQGF